MSDLFVREAASDDLHALALLESEARLGLAGARGGDRWLASVPVVGDRWPDRCQDRQWLVLVGGLDDVVLSYLAARRPDSLGIATIEQVFVTPGAREIGLGDTLVQRALDDLRERGATAVDAVALPGDRATKNLFERNGLTARLITVTRDLR